MEALHIPQSYPILKNEVGYTLVNPIFSLKMTFIFSLSDFLLRSAKTQEEEEEDCSLTITNPPLLAHSHGTSKIGGGDLQESCKRNKISWSFI